LLFAGLLWLGFAREPAWLGWVLLASAPLLLAYDLVG
jgi:hypothetical protein